MEYVILFLILFSNLWFWKILTADFLLGLLIIACSFCLYNISVNTKREYSVLFVFLFFIIMFFQCKYTERTSLTYLNNDEQRIQQMRLGEYPHLKISFIRKTIWVPIAHWFEGREESLIFYRLNENLSEVLDINLYFFANHPRERVGIKEFEKFAFIYLPFFLYGLVIYLKRNKIIVILVTLVLPLVITSLIGNKNPYGPFSFFPLFVSSISLGIEKGVLILKKNKFARQFSILLFFVFILVFLQQILYEFS